MTKGIRGFQKGNVPWSKGKTLGSKPEHSKMMKDYWKERGKTSETIKMGILERAKRHRDKYKEETREKTLWRKYKLTLKEFENILTKQNNKCSICGIFLDKHGLKVIKPHIDHDHEKGSVRGILCSRCNLLLGNASDSIEILKSATNYLSERL